ncbi:MAG TPA: rod shape-determining protein MreC [Dokdonella sp.]|uniref:rod shape-determining protein MreC n=1 Tax=Dokdonella sp. TaxID=2291710 RepID=UPI0025BCBAC9|nr:rod shape-determining protein MreC [Dokdonella sp.]MBX3690669.1 rod shape-determining protein MreC [Dokdonella sp.]HNR92815.1 rod shape-determining protein MreC [Dokdonella sp.]
MPLTRTDKVPLFAEGGVSTLRLIVYLTMAMIVMVVDHRAGYLEGLRQLASRVIEPVYRVAGLPAEAARAGRLAIATQSQLAEENRTLREALLLAQARLNRMAALAEQNERLKALLDVQNNLGLGVQLAHLVDVDLDPFRQRVVIDVGRAQGVAVGQPVLDAGGVMGQIVEVLPNTSVAMLITDPTHAIPVTIERTGLRAIVYGTGGIDRLQLPTIPISADVRVGDRLVTSGLGGRFPAGFPVGEILEISNDESGMFAAALARPAAALERSGDVLLLHDLPQPMGPPPPDASPDGREPTP